FHEGCFFVHHDRNKCCRCVSPRRLHRMNSGPRVRVASPAPLSRPSGIALVAGLAASAEAGPPTAAITVALPLNWLGRAGRQSIVVTLSQAVLNRQVATLDVASFTQTLPKGSQAQGAGLLPPIAEEPDHRHRRLLPARRHWPRSRRAAEKRDKLGRKSVDIIFSYSARCLADRG